MLFLRPMLIFSNAQLNYCINLGLLNQNEKQIIFSEKNGWQIENWDDTGSAVDLLLVFFIWWEICL